MAILEYFRYQTKDVNMRAMQYFIYSYSFCKTTIQYTWAKKNDKILKNWMIFPDFFYYQWMFCPCIPAKGFHFQKMSSTTVPYISCYRKIVGHELFLRINCKTSYKTCNGISQLRVMGKAGIAYHRVCEVNRSRHCTFHFSMCQRLHLSCLNLINDSVKCKFVFIYSWNNSE